MRSPSPGIRIVLTGAESSGKSTLTPQLGAYFNLPFAPEYARIYLEANGQGYDQNTLEHMWPAHLRFQNEHVPAPARHGILDTDLINYKIWSEVVFGNYSNELFHSMENETTHRYLLCEPDLPWEPDPLRENPNNRGELFERHHAEIIRLNRPYRTVRGQGDERLKNAITAVQELMAL